MKDQKPLQRRLVSLIILGVTLLVASGCCVIPAPPPEPPKEPEPVVEEGFKVDAEFIARDVLLGNPDKAMARISPDGKRMSYLAPVDGVLNVWVGPVDDPAAAKPVTEDKKRGVRIYFWAYTNKHIIYLQDTGGDENWHVYVTDLESGETKNLTPMEGVRAQIDEVSHLHPTEIMVGLNNRDPRLHDIHKLNIETGELTLVQENPGFLAFKLDHNYEVRFGVLSTPDGGMEVFTPKAKPKGKGKGKGKKKGKNKKTEEVEAPTDPMAAINENWESFTKIPMEDSLTTFPIGFDKEATSLYMIDSRNRDTAAFVTLNLESGESKVVAEDPRADLQDLMIHPTEFTVEAAGFTYDRKHWTILDKTIEKDFAALKKVADGDFEVTARTLDDTQWIVAFVVDDGPVRYYRYNRTDGKTHFLFTNRSALEKLPMVPMHPEIIDSRDGLKLVNYLSLPPGSDEDGDGRPDEPLPLVLNVHGGPWARVSWDYDPQHQWFANRGYAVLSVNFRGSTGFGKKFLNAGNKEWAKKMHDDLIDSVEWAVSEGIAIKDRVAIYGGSYGGYAALVGLTFTPEYFACGVDIVGPSNLITLLETIPPYWAPMIEQFTQRVGDHRTEEGRALLKERSPLTHADKIQRPLLIAQGANDPRVKQAESDQIVDAMNAKKIPVTYVLYPDEGHGFARPENRISFYAVTEAFLEECLGGRSEPVGDDFKGASIQVPAGAEHVPALKEALSGAE